MNHLAHKAAVPDGEPIEFRTWCDRAASSLALEDSMVFEAALSDCDDCKNERADTLHAVRPKLVAKTDDRTMKALDLPKGCNRHADCVAAEKKAAEDGRPERFGPGTARLSHCYDETCSDCFGS